MSDDRALADLRERADAAFAAGFNSLCLYCQQGFKGEVCPRCWPPSPERLQQAIGDLKYVSEMTPVHIYAWVCGRLGGTRDPESQERWFAVRDALSATVRP